MKHYLVLSVLSLFLSLTCFGLMALVPEPQPVAKSNWHPGFLEVDVEVIDPASTWFPPPAVPKNSLQQILVNVDHIVTVGMYRGHTSKTPRYAILLMNDLLLVVLHDYDDLLKLIRAAWVGAGKN